jgi:hypothetical protein
VKILIDEEEPMANKDTYTLNDIRDILGTPTELQAQANAPTEPDAELIRLGAQIASGRILTDVEGLYGLAYTFWLKTTPAQKDLLMGFSEEVLCYAVDRALALRELTTATDDAGFLDTKELARRKTAAATAFSDGLALRDRAQNILKKAAPNEETKRKVIDSVGTAEDDDKLAAGLDRLAAIGQTFLNPADDIAKARISAVRLSDTFIKSLGDAAKKVRKTAEDAAARTTIKKTTQGDIDRLDGVNLILLGDIVTTFEDAHDSDPSIPRLVPTSTRRLLGKKTQSPAKDKTNNETK